MYYVIYYSYAAHPFTDLELQLLLEESRNKSLQAGITGFLYDFHESFVQLIEGEELIVKALYRDICTGKRHRFPVILKDGFCEARFFPEWTMGYKKLTAGQIDQSPSTGPESEYIDTNVVLRLCNLASPPPIGAQ